MAGVTFNEDVGGDGSTVTDDGNASTGLAQDGHRTRFVPALAQIVAVATWVKTTALTVLGYKNSAAASEATALDYKNQAAGSAVSAAAQVTAATGQANDAMNYKTQAGNSASASASSAQAANLAWLGLGDALINGLGVFSVNSEGELIVEYDNGIISNLEINNDGELLITYN